MPRDSLKTLMDMFPWFFDKSSTSNFYKSQSVTNNQFKNVYNDVFKVYQSFHLNKNCLIWKEQSQPFEYAINFIANFPNMKTVTLYKNDEVIYTDEYTSEENVNSFEYAYNCSTLDEFETVFYDNASSSDHREDWDSTEELSVDYDEDGPIITEDDSNFGSYYANFEGTENSIIEFDIQALNMVGSIKFFYKNADIHLNNYLRDSKKHHIKVECKNDYVVLYVDNIEQATFGITSENTSCRFILKNASVKFSDFSISTVSAKIIPQNKFKMEITTYDEYSISKGWPENDTIEGNEYDHDESLDEIGALHDIPRKEYLIVNEELYGATEPPYNDRASEDDYHYMKRILDYMLMYHTTPLPVLEIWKMYGINATLENREKLLLKVFDLEKHPNFIDDRKDSQGNYIADGDRWFSGTLDEAGNINEWTPNAWEHKDKFCDYTKNLGKYFFVKASTKIPVKNQNVVFSFRFLDSLAHELGEECSVDVFLNNTLLYEDVVTNQITIQSNQIPQDIDNIFTFRGKDSQGEIIDTQDVKVTVRGCNSGSFYVDPVNGSDSYDGKSRSTAFQTIQKAVNSVNGDRNLIVLLSGLYEISSPVLVRKDCSILGCGGVIIENLTENLFFKVYPHNTLNLQDLALQYKGDFCNVSTNEFTNKNGNNEVADVIIYFTNAPVLIMTRLDLSFVGKNHCVGDTITFSGSLHDRLNNPLAAKNISVKDNKTIARTLTTNSNGAYTGSLIAERMGDLTLNASYNGDSIYKSSLATATTTIKMRLTDLLSKYDSVVMDLQYTNNNDWKYTTKNVNEITKLSDLDGAILNLQFINEEVQFERFYSYSDEVYVTKTDMEKLRGLLVGIIYDDEYNVKYTNAQLYGESVLTVTTPTTEYTIGDTITFSGTLHDKYDDPIPNKTILVNNQICVTDENGVYTGSVFANSVGNFYLQSKFEGSYDFEESSVKKKLHVRIPISRVFAGYSYVVTDLQYDAETHEWTYTKKAVSRITKLSDLNNCIKNLVRVNDNVVFERFNSTSTSSSLSKTELQSLSGLLVGISYDDYEVEYTNLHLENIIGSINISADKPIIESSEDSIIKMIPYDVNGSPLANTEIKLYEVYTPSISLRIDKQVIQNGDTVTIKMILKDEDGSRIRNQQIKLYKVE